MANSKELERRYKKDQQKNILASLSQPFFVPEEVGLDMDIFRDIADLFAIEVVFGKESYFCLRREFPGEVIVEQIGEVAGRYFAPPHMTTAPAFLKENSVGEKEAANILNIDRNLLLQLASDGELDHFFMDGKLRFWRSDIEDLKRDGYRLYKLARENEKLRLPEAAVLLGVTISQFKRLVAEGRISPLPGGGEEKYPLFRRHEVEKLRKSLPATVFPSPKKQLPNTRKKRPVLKKPPAAAPEGPFVLDEFQTKAVEALRRGCSVLVAAPTGNGKTLVAEILARDLMAKAQGMVYTSPLKALSNQKYRDFKEIFGDEEVGLVTGDISINPGAPLLIMTTEIFRNWCFSEPEELSKIAYVVFDEIHYLDDMERGTTWEESILFAPPHIKILGLSATVPNVEEIAHWISSVRGEEVVVIREDKRHVPLKIRWILPNGRIVGEREARAEISEWQEYLKALRSRRYWAGE